MADIVVGPNESHKLTVDITNRSTKAGVSVAVTVRVIFNVYEGSVWAGAGTLLNTLTVESAALKANGISTVTSPAFTTTLGTIDRRDVGIEIWYGGNKVASAQFDDVFYVREPVIELAFEITNVTVS